MSRTIKKDMSLLMVLMSVLSFVIMPVSVYAQGNCTAAETCPSCPKAQLWHIPVTCTAIPQGGSASNAVFDFDATYGYCEQALPTGGYLGYPGSRNVNVVNNKLIMNICCCPDACDFELGDVVGVELEILTKGVYWAADANVPALAPAEPNCYGGGNSLGAATMYGLTFSRWSKGSVSTLHSVACNNGAQPVNSTTNELDNVDVMKVAYYTASRSITLQDGTALTADARPKILRTPTPYDGYELTSADISQNLCDFWIDVPAMIAYSTEITAGATVQVKAKLLVSKPYSATYTDGGVDTNCDDIAHAGNIAGSDNITLGNLSYLRPALDPGIWGTAGTAFENDPPRCQPRWTAAVPPAPDAATTYVGTGWVDVTTPGVVDDTDSGCKWRWPSKFCPDCQSPCSCTVDVGILCCTASITPVSSCIYFPYVLSGMQDQGWVTGIGLSRICDPATGTEPTVTLQLTDCSGVDYTATPTFTYCLGTSGMTIDGMISDLTWTPAIPADYSGQWVLRVNANFVIDGYQFNLNSSGGGMFGAGVLPRQSCPCQ